MAENTNTERDYPEFPEELTRKDRGRLIPRWRVYEIVTAMIDADRKTRASLPLPAAGQEPVARVNDDGFIVETGLLLSPGMKLYAAPQPAVAAGWVMVPASVIESAITALDWMPTSDAARHLWDRQQPVLALLRSSIPPAPSTEGESR
ncbi:hypothetical protein [Acidovorax sp. FJL06]|uniref:hypothetical protein n=1 Tax=Acidovorax sp. FJL06 TaxID=2153365 RepID=UPI000F56BE8A|nr:hypothetical protein [Acidovorax sp. FJL06]